MKISMNLAILIGLACFLTLALAVPVVQDVDADAFGMPDSDAIVPMQADLENGEVAREVSDAVQEVSDAEKSSRRRRRRWLRRRRRRSSERRRRSLWKRGKTHLQCSISYNKCMCGHSTCFFSKKFGNKKMCKIVSDICKLVGNNPELVNACKTEANRLLSKDPHGVERGEAVIKPIVMKSPIHKQIKSLVTKFFSMMSEDCKDEARAMSKEKTASKKEKGKKLNAFMMKCVARSTMPGHKQVMELLQVRGEHDSFWISVLLSDILTAVFG